MYYYACESDVERLELLTRQMDLEPAEDFQAGPLPPGGQEVVTVKEVPVRLNRSAALDRENTSGESLSARLEGPLA